MKKYKINTLRNIKTIILLKVLLAFYIFPTQLTAQVYSGSDFWIMFNSNIVNTEAPLITLFITSAVNTSGVVSGPSFASIPFTVTANAVTPVIVPATVANHVNDFVSNKGIRITALNDVVVRGLNQKNYSTDGFLSIPVNQLGTNYSVLTYGNNGLSQYSTAVSFGIVGTVNGTTVNITPSVNASMRLANVPYTIILNEGSTYELRCPTDSFGDFTGTSITSSQPIGVYGANSCAFIPDKNCMACDHLSEMLPPTSRWGNSFFTNPFIRSLPLNGDRIKILAREDETFVTINGVVHSAVLDAGQSLELALNAATKIETTKPVLIAQFASGSVCSGSPGDPFMMIVPPIDQYFNSQSLTTASGFTHHYINIVAPNVIVGSMTDNGVIIPSVSFTPIGTTGYSSARITATPGVHLLNGGLPFCSYIYGLAEYNSYCFSGGQLTSPVANVANLVLIPDSVSGEACTNICWNAHVTDQFNSPIPGVPVNFDILGINSAKSGYAYTDVNGIARFCYTGFSGNDSIIARAGSIGDTSTFTWDPSSSVTTPVMSSSSPICSGNPLNLFVSSAGSTSYSWTGPNGFKSDLQNPTIPVATLFASGTYNVIINGCVMATTAVTVNAAPSVSAITSNSPVCTGGNLKFNLSGYCVPVKSRFSCPYRITNVSTVGGIINFSHPSLCAPTNYADYSNTVGVSATPGSTLTVTISTQFGGYSTDGVGIAIWIDYNDDAVFDDSEKAMDHLSMGISVHSASFVVANFPGVHRMRVRADLVPIADACHILWLGETEDYYIDVSGTKDITYAWSGPDGFTSSLMTPTLPTVTPIASGNYTITATSPAGCSSSKSIPVTVYPQLSGTYTINSSLPAGGTNFNSFTHARNQLICGIAGPVVFEVDPLSGPYLEQVNFPVIPGTSSVNTVTFNCNGREITFAGTDAAAPSTLELGGADYFRFNNLTISANGTSNAMACHLWNGSDNNIFTNCTMRCNSNNITSNMATLSISGSRTIATNGAMPGSINNVFTGCTIQFGHSGVVIYGNSQFPAAYSGNQIINCSIQDAYRYSVFNRDNSGTVISGNTIERPTRTTPIAEFYGVHVDGYVSNMLFEKNRIRNPYGANPNSSGNATGIWHSVNLPGNENKYINNVISDFNPNGGFYGIALAGNATNTRVYHNTIYFNQPSSTSGSNVMGIMNSSTTSKDIRNNIVDIRRSGNGSKYLIYNYASGSSINDNNNLFYTLLGGNSFTGYLQATDYATLASWQSTGNDLLSTSVDPVYTDPGSGNFLPTNPALSDIGANVGVTTDITGAPRSSTNPDPGAYEFGVSCSLTVNAGPDESTFFGYSGDQQITRTATVNGGTAPFTYSWTAGRALSCNSVTSSGDEIFSGGTCVHTVCPTSGALSGIASCTGSASVTIRLIDTTDVCVTVTDANNCSATDCFTVNAIDARCFAGNSQISKVYVCHYTGNNNNPWVQICIDDDAVSAHLANNSADYLGHCNARYAAAADESPAYLYLYPNPARNEVAIGTNGVSGSPLLRIINVLGQVVINKTITLTGSDNFTVNVNSLVPGIYKVVLQDELELREGIFVKE